MKTVSHHPIELSAMFPPGTAGNDMLVDLPIYEEESLSGDVQKSVITHAKNFQSINYIYVVDEKKVLKGVLSIRELLQASPKKHLKTIMHKKVVSVNPFDQVAEVVLLALQNNVKMLPIVDHKNRMVGAYGSQQLLDILNKEAADDLLRLSGITIPRKHFHFNPRQIFRGRILWMFIGMFGGLATGFIISFFQTSIKETVLLAVFIPVIMSTGATSANQSAMVFLRNFIHGDVQNRANYLFNELKIASLIAVTLSFVLFLVLLAMPGYNLLALAVSISLFATVIAGAVIGVLTPMVLAKYKIDPSTGAGPFLTIIKDLIAMTIYFTVSTFILYYFG